MNEVYAVIDKLNGGALLTSLTPKQSELVTDEIPPFDLGNYKGIRSLYSQKNLSKQTISPPIHPSQILGYTEEIKQGYYEEDVELYCRALSLYRSIEFPKKRVRDDTSWVLKPPNLEIKIGREEHAEMIYKGEETIVNLESTLKEIPKDLYKFISEDKTGLYIPISEELIKKRIQATYDAAIKMEGNDFTLGKTREWRSHNWMIQEVKNLAKRANYRLERFDETVETLFNIGWKNEFANELEKLVNASKNEISALIETRSEGGEHGFGKNSRERARFILDSMNEFQPLNSEIRKRVTQLAILYEQAEIKYIEGKIAFSQSIMSHAQEEIRIAQQKISNNEKEIKNLYKLKRSEKIKQEENLSKFAKNFGLTEEEIEKLKLETKPEYEVPMELPF